MHGLGFVELVGQVVALAGGEPGVGCVLRFGVLAGNRGIEVARSEELPGLAGQGGLDIALVRSLAQGHDGRIWLHADKFLYCF